MFPGSHSHHLSSSQWRIYQQCGTEQAEFQWNNSFLHCLVCSKVFQTLLSLCECEGVQIFSTAFCSSLPEAIKKHSWHKWNLSSSKNEIGACAVTDDKIWEQHGTWTDYWMTQSRYYSILCSFFVESKRASMTKNPRPSWQKGVQTWISVLSYNKKNVLLQSLLRYTAPHIYLLHRRTED